MRTLNQVCTLDQAKRLNELGINQPAIFEYKWYRTGYVLMCGGYKLVSVWTGSGIVHQHTGLIGKFHAYSVAELGEMLPDRNDESLPLQFHWTDDAFCEGTRLHFPNIYKPKLQYGYETEAAGRAEVLIHLLESNFVTAAECNDRLIATNPKDEG
jgi:hypothetical protein